MPARQEMIIRAIRDCRVIAFTFRLQRRLVEPHTLGYDHDDTLVLCGRLRSRVRGGFRDFHVATLNRLAIIGEQFERPRPGYHSIKSMIRRVIYRLPERAPGEA